MISWIDIAPFGIYLAILAVIALLGLKHHESGQESLILAGRRLTLPAFVATLVSTWYGGILGVGEFSYRYGLSNWLVFGVPYYIAAALFALFLAGRARRSAELTIPDRLFHSYGTGASVAGAGIVIVVTLPVANLLMMGVLLNQLFGIPFWIGIMCSAIFSVFHVFTGGFRAVLESDYVQFTLMYVGFIILFIFAVTHLGGWSYLKTNLPAAHFSATGGNTVGYIALWYIIALLTLVDPAFYQRCFAAKSPAVARRGIFVCILFWIVFDFMTTACGLYARAYLPNLTDPMTAYPALARAILPTGVLGIFLLSVMAIVMSTVDSYVFITATTFSHDILWRFKRFDDSRMKFYTGVGLAASSVVMILLSLAFHSVVTVWHDFGSVGTAALLLPLMLSYWGNYRYSSRGALVSIVLSAMITIVAIFIPRWIGMPGYFLGIEPIFIGLAVSIIVFLFAHTKKMPAEAQTMNSQEVDALPG
jgi:solute:Na+ symporter, SSS family